MPENTSTLQTSKMPVGTQAGQIEVATSDNEYLTITVEAMNDAGRYLATIEGITMTCS